MFLNIFEGAYFHTTVTSATVGVAINKVLLGKLEEFTSLDEVITLDGGG